MLGIVDLLFQFFHFFSEFFHLLRSHFLFVFIYGKMLFVCTLVLPFKAIAHHHLSQCFFLGLHPLAPFRLLSGAALKALHGERLFQRNACIKPASASDHIRDEINVQVRRGFIHMQMCGENAKLRIALLKSDVVFLERCFRLYADLGIRAGILPVADLNDDLMERFFLFSVDDVLVVIRDDTVTPFLLCVVPRERVVEQFVIDCLDLFVAEAFDYRRTALVHGVVQLVHGNGFKIGRIEHPAHFPLIFIETFVKGLDFFIKIGYTIIGI